MSEGVIDLARRKCQPCQTTDRLTDGQIRDILKNFTDWTIKDATIEREFRFKSFRAGLDFAYAVGNLAEEQDHHPNIWIGWRRVKLMFSTRVIKGLSMNDFVMAAKAELLYQEHM